MKEVEKQKALKNRSSWTYTITWFTKGKKPLFKDEIEQHVKEIIFNLCEEQAILLDAIALSAHSIKIGIEANEQLNTTKLVKNLQKKLSTLLYKVLNVPVDGMDLFEEEETLITTVSGDLAKVDLRLEKLLNAVIDVAYYDMEDGLGNKLENLKKYLLEQKLSVIEKGEQLFLIDEEALRKEINLNCFACTKLYQYGCCCGSPCHIGPRNRKLFDKHLLNIEEEVKAYDRTTYEKILKKGGLITSDGSINECNGHCALLVEEEGIYKCAAHKYAVQREISIYELCPLSCLMFPLEILELITNKQRKIIFLTSVVNEAFAEHFGRWGSYNSLEVELRCINKKAHNDIFKEEDYKPVYEVNKELLSHEFGNIFYKELMQIMQKSSSTNEVVKI